jgi:malate permease and related proteins
VTDLFDVFIQNILPIFLVAGMGFILRRSLSVSTSAVSSATFYVFSPALVFSSLMNNRLPADELLQIAAFAVVSTAAMALVALIFARLLRLSRAETSAIILVLVFVNSGNYGLTLNELRYGTEGLARAVVFFVVSTMLVFSAGILIASMGRAGWRASLIRLARLPAFYAVVLAVPLYSLDVQLPAPIERTIAIAGAGAIPAMLLVLGMQIADLRSLKGVWLAVPASLMRVALAPLIAVILADAIGLSGVGRSTSILEASMPTAVVTTILATEFDVRPDLVTTSVVLTTLLSGITLPAVVTILGL